MDAPNLLGNEKDLIDATYIAARSTGTYTKGQVYCML